MFNKIILFSLKNRLIVVALAAIIVSYGGFLLTRIPVDVFPNLNRPTVTIFTEAEGLAPEEVETLVTRPIETAINGSTGVERVRSASAIGLSIVWVEFGWKQDVYLARQLVTEKLQQSTSALPKNVKPVMGPISSIMGEIMLVGLTSDNPTVDAVELRTLADWTLRKRLLSIPGISQVTVIGGEKKQLQVKADPFKLYQAGVGLRSLETAIEKSGGNSTGGFLIGDYRESLIRNLARVNSASDLRKAVVPTENQRLFPLTLGDLAEVTQGGAPQKRGDAGVNGEQAVILSIQKQPDGDTVRLTKRIEEELRAAQKGLSEGVKIHSDIFRQSVFIDKAISNVIDSLRDGSVFVAIVLFIFLLNFRITLITLTAIPVSLIISIIVFRAFGLSINTMTLGGLAVAIGELVDDAIVGVENVFRRLRENHFSIEPKPALDVVWQASSEVRNSIVFASILEFLVFIPLFFLDGIEGKIFAPLGVAYIISIVASLGVSLTLTPVLSLYLMPNVIKKIKPDHHTGGWLVKNLKSFEGRLLNWAFPRTKKVLGVVIIIFVISLGLVPFFGKEFLPPFNEGSLTINLLTPPGTSLLESSRIGSLAEKLILQVPEVNATGRRTGRAELDDHAEGVHSSEIEVELKTSKRSREKILSDIRARLDTIPGIAVNVGQPISHRIDHLLSGVKAQVAVKIYGEDLLVLRAKAEEVRRVMLSVPGVVDLFVEKQVLVPQTHVIFDRDLARSYGVMLGDAAEVAEIAMNGKEIGQVIEGGQVQDMTLRLKDNALEDLEALKNVPLETKSGKLIPLSLVSTIKEAKGPNLVSRENGERRIYVSANVTGRDLVSTVTEMQKKIDKAVKLPTGYHITFGGQFESQASAAKMISLLGIVSLLGMFVVLFLHFKSRIFAAQVMMNIPLAMIGAVAGVLLSGGVFSIATLVGFITLTGISARNGIMMISHYLHLMRHEGEKFNLPMIIRGTQERIVPVMMTALTAAIALLPLVISFGQPGREILHPMAVVIFFGLFSSTALDLVVTPLVFWKFGKKSVARLIPQALSE